MNSSTIVNNEKHEKERKKKKRKKKNNILSKLRQQHAKNQGKNHHYTFSFFRRTCKSNCCVENSPEDFGLDAISKRVLLFWAFGRQNKTCVWGVASTGLREWRFVHKNFLRFLLLFVAFCSVAFFLFHISLFRQSQTTS
jgi:hypothetical protein